MKLFTILGQFQSILRFMISFKGFSVGISKVKKDISGIIFCTFPASSKLLIVSDLKTKLFFALMKGAIESTFVPVQ